MQFFPSSFQNPLIWPYCSELYSLYALKNSYCSQFLKNYELLRKSFKKSKRNSLDFEYLYDEFHSKNFPNEILEFQSETDDEKRAKIAYVLIGLLSIYEVDKNLSHFLFVNFHFLCYFCLKWHRKKKIGKNLEAFLEFMLKKIVLFQYWIWLLRKI